MRYSRQRNLILETIQKNAVHPTAEQVYFMVKEQEPAISLGTVYRNLNLLSETGQLKKITVRAGSDRFDGRTDQHSHMSCIGCGKVFDYDDIAELEIETAIERSTGFHTTHLEVIIEGYCEECAAKNSTASAQ